MRSSWLFLSISLLVLPACGGSEEPPPRTAAEHESRAQRAYEAALEDFHDRNWERLIPRLEEIERRYGDTPWGRLATLRIADAQFNQGKFMEASGSYRGFVRSHPNHTEVPYARYRTAKALFSASSTAPLLPPLEERDLAQVRDAHQTTIQHIADYPGSKWATELEYMRQVTAGTLARYELYVARFYLAEDRFEAASARVRTALTLRKGSGLEPEALVLLAEIRLKMKEPEAARELLQQVLTSYPDSAFIVPARQFLSRLGPKPERDAPAP
jgi:outer membrane protein assembly factor BamD